MNLTEKFLAARADKALEKLHKVDQFWLQLRSGSLSHHEVIKTSSALVNSFDFDVVICGGTLGILLGATLQRLGIRVAVIERGILKGRQQEWNISRQELATFCELGLLSSEELEEAIATEYNLGRIGFLGGEDIWVRNVLNIGVDPVYLIEKCKQKFLQAKGKLLENNVFQTAIISNSGVEITTSNQKLTARLLIDAMGHFSPIVRQIRAGSKPDAICTVVGSCATGYQKNDTGDLIYSFTPIINQCQYFWEAFPAREGRTTYMFSYLDADPQRPSLEYFMSEYLRLLPQYQNIELSQLDFQRFLYGFFPAYRQSPLKIPFDRLLAVGDSNGGQSPVSFGGFGSMVRHLKRLTSSIEEALRSNSLKKSDLALIQPYQPNISVTWLFQKTMSVGVSQQAKPNQINELMNGVFAVMAKLGDQVIQPFLQDVIQLLPLTKTLPLVNPKLVLPILMQIGINPLADWSWQYLNLAIYSGLYPLGKVIKTLSPKLSPQQKYYLNRYLDAWKYGSGGDFLDSLSPSSLISDEHSHRA